MALHIMTIASQPSITNWPVPGGWAEQRLRLESHDLNLIVPANPDELLNHLDDDEFASCAADPYWARLWPTAITLGKMIVRRAWPVGGEAIELGCGIGVAGIAGLLVGLNVTFTDYIPLAVELAVENARRNGLSNGRGVVMDWNSPPKQQYCAVLASDILYDEKLYEPILNLLDIVLADNGTCWIADPGRYHAERFIQQARGRCYEVALRNESGCDLVSPPAAEFCLIELRRTRSSS